MKTFFYSFVKWIISMRHGSIKKSLYFGLLFLAFAPAIGGLLLGAFMAIFGLWNGTPKLIALIFVSPVFAYQLFGLPAFLTGVLVGVIPTKIKFYHYALLCGAAGFLTTFLYFVFYSMGHIFTASMPSVTEIESNAKYLLYFCAHAAFVTVLMSRYFFKIPTIKSSSDQVSYNICEVCGTKMLINYGTAYTKICKKCI